MNVIGLGTDIAEIERIAAMIDRHGDEFLQRVFGPEEIAYCAGHRNSAQHFAGRWAAKEAILKALGTGFTKGIGWNDLTILPMATGRPVVTLTGRARTLADELGIDRVIVSISHGKNYAMATAMAMGSGEPL